jgi:hypothetical protein
VCGRLRAIARSLRRFRRQMIRVETRLDHAVERALAPHLHLNLSGSL